MQGLYRLSGSKFNPDWKVPDITATDIDWGELKDELQDNRVLKYLTPARFWPKGISYFPRHMGVKDKYPGYKDRHEQIVSVYLTKLYEAGILYKRVSRSKVSFKGTVQQWEQKYQVERHGRRNVQELLGSESRGSRKISHSKISNLSQKVPVAKSSGDMGGTSPDVKGDAHHFLSPGWRHLEPMGCCHPAQKHAIQSKVNRDSGTIQYRRPERTSGRCRPQHIRFAHPVAITTTRAASAFTTSGRRATGSQLRYSSTAWKEPEKGKNLKDESERFLQLPSPCPRRPTGRIFLVDKNSRDTASARLVVDFSQFSRGRNKMSFPKYWAPNLRSLSRILPMEMSRISLDVSQAFYHIPMHPLSALRLAISDGQRVYYFRKAAMGVGISPFLLHLLSTAIATEIANRYAVWAFAYMDDFLLCHPSSRYLATVSNSVCHFLQRIGVRINYDKHTPSPVTEIKFLGYVISNKDIRIPDETWKKTEQIIKKIRCYKEYDFKIIQRLCGHLNFMLPFTVYPIDLLSPMYKASANNRNFVFSKTYKCILLKALRLRHKIKLQPKESVPIPRLATDATLDIGAISHITGGWSHVHFNKVRHIHIQELMMVLCARLLVNPRSMLVDSRYVCHKRYHKLPWLFALYANILLSRTLLYFVPSRYNPADGPTRGRPPDWSEVYYSYLGKPLKVPSRLWPV